MKRTTEIVHWIPRVLCILVILFISMFALDSFDPRLTLWQQIGGFLIHLIPTYILVALLVVAWKWELTGGILFVLLAAGFSPVVYNINHYRNEFSVRTSLEIVLMITFPFLLVGGLFLLSHFLKKNQSGNPENGKVRTGNSSHPHPAITP
jgi:hypothetical protein